MGQSKDSVLLHAKTKVLKDSTKMVIDPKEKTVSETEIKTMNHSNVSVIKSQPKVYGADVNKGDFRHPSSAAFRRKNSNL